MKNHLTLSRAIDLSIKLMDVNIKELSTKSGVSPSQISRFRKGERDLTASSFACLVRALPSAAQDAVFDCIRQELEDSDMAVKLLAKTL
jgi:predicted transcriptional regulator